MKRILLPLWFCCFGWVQAWACSCWGIGSFCSTYDYVDQIIYGRIDSVTSANLVYVTVLETIKGNQPNTQLVVADDPKGELHWGSCYTSPFWTSTFTAGDTAMIAISDSSFNDTLSGLTVSIFEVLSCTSSGAILMVSNGEVTDRSETFNQTPPYSTIHTITLDVAVYKQNLQDGICVDVVGINLPLYNEQAINFDGSTFWMSTEAGSGTFTCYNLTGQKVATSKGNSISTQGFETGVYIVEFSNEQGVIRKKFYLP